MSVRPIEGLLRWVRDWLREWAMRGCSESASGEEKSGRGELCWAPIEGEGEGELRTKGLLRTVERGRPFGGALMVEAARWCRRVVS